MNNKRALTILLLAILVLSCVFSLVGCGPDKGNEYLKKAEVNVWVQENGDIKVEETWNVHVGYDSIRNLYREINVYDTEFTHYSLITDYTVKNNLTGEELTYYPDVKDPEEYENSHLVNNSYVFQKNYRKYEVGFYFPKTSNADLSFTMSYTLTDMVRVHGDTAVLYYQPFSDDFSLYIEELNVNVYQPNGAPLTEETLAWYHTEVEGAMHQREQAHLNFNAKVVETGNYTEVRVLMPKELFKGAVKTDSALKKESIKAEEQKWFEDYERELERTRNRTLYSTILGVLLAVFSALAVVYFQVFYPKVKGEYPPYVREIPEGMTSTKMAHFYYHYKGTIKKQKNRGNALSAMVMDLARRGFINLLPDPSDKDDYVIEMASVPDAKMGELHSYEREIYELLSLVGDYAGGAFNMKDFEAYAKSNPTIVNNKINACFRESGRGYNNKDNFKRPHFKTQTIFGIGFVGAVLGFMIFLLGDSIAFFGLGALIAGIILMIGYPRGSKLSEKGEANYMQAKGLEAFLLDFSNLKEHEIPALILWEEYMVYATMMGISEKVLQELKLKYPELSESANVDRGYYRSHSYLYFYVHMHTHYGMRDFGQKMNLSFTNVSKVSHHLVQAINAKNSSSKLGGGRGFGGGGFRGGGGGFGGGGGGAR